MVWFLGRYPDPKCPNATGGDSSRGIGMAMPRLDGAPAMESGASVLGLELRIPEQEVVAFSDEQDEQPFPKALTGA